MLTLGEDSLDLLVAYQTRDERKQQRDGPDDDKR